MSKDYPKKTKTINKKKVMRLTLEDFKEMDDLFTKKERAKIVIVKNKSGIHIDFRSYKNRYRKKNKK